MQARLIHISLQGAGSSQEDLATFHMASRSHDMHDEALPSFHSTFVRTMRRTSYPDLSDWNATCR